MAVTDHTPESHSSKRNLFPTRPLKVRKGRYTRTIQDKDHDHFNKTVDRSIPLISFQGHWVEKAGITINIPITIKVPDGCLVLTKEERS